MIIQLIILHFRQKMLRTLHESCEFCENSARICCWNRYSVEILPGILIIRLIEINPMRGDWCIIRDSVSFGFGVKNSNFDHILTIPSARRTNSGYQCWIPHYMPHTHWINHPRDLAELFCFIDRTQPESLQPKSSSTGQLWVGIFRWDWTRGQDYLGQNGRKYPKVSLQFDLLILQPINMHTRGTTTCEKATKSSDTELYEINY